jgi:ribA/ribD-fused uncharacterized protein
MSHDDGMSPEERLDALRVDDTAGRPIDTLAFWSHWHEPDGSIGRGCLSQWWLAEFTVDGVAYATAEHWMMAAKARLFGDATGLATVLAAQTPYAAKAAGRAVKGFDERRWRRARYDIVVEGNQHKFGQHPELADFLRRTGSQVLVEASPYDRIWGIGLAADHENVNRPSRWNGLNLLGFALLDVREQL